MAENQTTPIQETIATKEVELKKIQNKPKGKRGGARPGAGRKQGKYSKIKLEAKREKERFDQSVLRGSTKLFNAQFDKALGEKLLFVRYYTGKGKDRKKHVEVVTDPDIIKEYIIDDGITLNSQSDDEYFYITTRSADNQAIDSLLNRAFGRAPDKLEITGGFFSQQKLTIEVINGTNADDEPKPIEGEVVSDPKPDEGQPPVEPTPAPSPSAA